MLMIKIILRAVTFRLVPHRKFINSKT